jgi:hypothetical protein
MQALKKSPVKIEYPKRWVPVLRNAVLDVQAADIRTVEALCVALAHDDTDAGRVLEKLLEFLPRSIRNDGAIWKADHYFWTDHRIHYRRMVRARRNLKPVMESWKQKAQGSPTWHYHLDAEALVLGMARALDCSTAYMRMLILQNQNDENAPKTVKSAKSITLDSDLDSDSKSNLNSKTVTEIEFALIGEGLHAKTATEFAAMNPLTVRRVIETVREMDAAGKIRKNKAAVLVTTLRREMTPPPGSNLREWEQRTLTPQPPLPHGEGEQGEEQDEPLYRGLLIPEAPKVQRKDLAFRYGACWNAALNQLEVQLDRANFDTWLRGTWLMDVEDSHPTDVPGHDLALRRAGEGNLGSVVFIVGVRNTFAKDMLEHRLYRSVRRVLSDAAGMPVELRFEIAQVAD